MSSTDAWTIGKLLQWTADYLKQRGAVSPRLDAEVLLAKARGCQRIELYTAFNDVADEPLRASFREMVKQRADGMPVAYLVGYKEFFSMPLSVSPAVLIPRPETELVVTAVLDIVKGIRDSKGPIRVADVGTGSGAIAIAVAKHAPTTHVTAIDISPEAILIAEENARRHGVDERVTPLVGDLLESLPADASFEIVASNPPYVSEIELRGMTDEVTRHEPHLALVAGEHGTDIIERLAPQAAERLVAGGHLIMEISPMIESSVLEMLQRIPQFEEIGVTKDLAGLPRVVTARKRA